MAETPTIIITTDAAKVDVNRVFDATGRGPATCSVPLVAADDETATYETPATHWFGQDMSATDDLAITWLAMTQGDLPLISGTWGEDGVISAQDAQAACMNGNLWIFSAGGIQTTQERDNWRDSVIAGMGLKRRPDEPI